MPRGVLLVPSGVCSEAPTERQGDFRFQALPPNSIEALSNPIWQPIVARPPALQRKPIPPWVEIDFDENVFVLYDGKNLGDGFSQRFLLGAGSAVFALTMEPPINRCCCTEPVGSEKK